MTVRGGLRSRCIADSVRVMFLAGLLELGWFDADRAHKPITFSAKPQDWDTNVDYNTFAITPETDVVEPGGLGDDPGGRTRFYVDFFAENDSIATHFSYDARDIAKGLVAGRLGPVCDVYDMSTIVDGATRVDPVGLTRVDLENIRIDRPSGFPRDWQRHWIVISFWAEDDFLELSPTAVAPAPWTEAMWTAWRTVRTVVDQ